MSVLNLYIRFSDCRLLLLAFHLLQSISCVIPGVNSWEAGWRKSDCLVHTHSAWGVWSCRQWSGRKQAWHLDFWCSVVASELHFVLPIGQNTETETTDDTYFIVPVHIGAHVRLCEVSLLLINFPLVMWQQYDHRDSLTSHLNTHTRTQPPISADLDEMYPLSWLEFIQPLKHQPHRRWEKKERGDGNRQHERNLVWNTMLLYFFRSLHNIRNK